MLKWILWPVMFVVSTVMGFLMWAYWWATTLPSRLQDPLTPERRKPHYRGFMYE
jgi:hypothetical protein